MYEDVFLRHEKVALQFSGGKDSIAVLFLMKPFWDQLTVYHVASADPFPENVQMADKVRAMVPNFQYVLGRQQEVMSKYGYPSDLVPYSSTPFGRVHAGDRGLPMLDRYTCCYESIMSPLQQAMHEDGITLIIRGQRNSDRHKSRLRSGDVSGGFEVLFPIEDWSDEQVLEYLRRNDIPVPRFYEDGAHGFDCMSCTAWLEHGQGAYMKKHFPKQYASRQKRLSEMKAEIEPILAAFNED